MTMGTFYWKGTEIPFREGESLAAALTAQGIRTFGLDAHGRETRYFCGIGACQSCLVRVGGVAVEACLTPAVQGLLVESLEQSDG